MKTDETGYVRWLRREIERLTLERRDYNDIVGAIEARIAEIRLEIKEIKEPSVPDDEDEPNRPLAIEDKPKINRTTMRKGKRKRGKMSMRKARDIRRTFRRSKRAGQTLTYEQLGDMFGLSLNTIGRIIREDIWQEEKKGETEVNGGVVVNS